MLKNLIKKMTPLQKLSLAMIIVFIGIASIIGFSFSMQSKQNKILEAQTLTQKLRTSCLKLRKNEKDFIMRHKLQYVDDFKKNFLILQNDLQQLKNFTSNIEIKNNDLNLFEQSTNNYKKLFFTLVSKQKELGLDKNSGIYKDLMQTKDELENLTKSNTQTYTKILILNSLVDQFLIEKNPTSLDKFLNTYTTLYTTLNLPLLQKYKNIFIKYVKLQKEIGFSEQDGIHKLMIENIHKTKEIIHSLTKQLNIIFQTKTYFSKLEFIAISIIISVIILLVAILIFRDIKNSLITFKSELREFFKYLNRETNSIKLLDDSSNGTVGQISKDVNKYILKTQKQLKEDQNTLQEFINVFASIGEGDLSKRVTIKTDNKAFEELKNISNDMIDNLSKNIKNTLSILEKYTKDDYTSKIDTSNLKYDFKLLATGVNHLQSSITKIFKENKTNAKILKEHSNVLEHHAKILTNTSTKQKESMKQSIKSINEISTCINNGHKSIENMAIITSKLLTSVDNGLQLVDKTNNSMNLINTQAKQISQTLKIMDEIALQTSILSLNASVEASNAGEAGKGFAVVAEEVRNLALKSTQAANQIKEIVQETENKIIDGQEVSSQLIEGFNELSNYIHTTTDYIDTLSHGIDEQNSSLEKVNNTIPTLENAITKNSKIASQTDEIVSDIDVIIEKIVASTQKQIF